MILDDNNSSNSSSSSTKLGWMALMGPEGRQVECRGIWRVLRGIESACKL